MEDVKQLVKFFENVQPSGIYKRVIHEKWCQACSKEIMHGCMGVHHSACLRRNKNVLIYGKWFCDD